MAIFTLRDIKTKLSNKQYLAINLLEAPVLAFILAFIVRYIPEDTHIYHFSENLNIPVFYFMSVIVAIFMGLTVSAEEIIKDRKILIREQFLHLSRLSYVLSKILILFSISALQTALFTIISSTILGVKGMFFPFWLVLFSISCFANLLGLNISSGFKSAVTVYILIPLLIIPQLILSGVVISFDKLNPVITSEDRVPLIGEVMASRWGFEALAVHQFQHNGYEKLFYDDDKAMAKAEFKTAYLLPRLKEDLQYISSRLVQQEETTLMDHKCLVLYHEIGKELKKIGEDKFPQVGLLPDPANWNADLVNTTNHFLDKLNSYYNLLYKKASASKQQKINELKTEGSTKHEELKQQYANKAIGTLVKNLVTEHRILEHNNEYIQKIYPIYHDPDHPDHALDFRAQFYQPTKYLAGIWIPTLTFNTLMIWFMSMILLVALYFDWLKKFIQLIRL